ncbi:MAG: hypothetical protein AAFZ18_20225, partial [Myxococcota bacterium]
MSPPTVEASGDRLSARYVEADGGARRFLHFVDRETGEPCRVATQGRDETTAYCVPFAVGTLLYRNSNCENPVVATSAAGHAWVSAAHPHGEPVFVRLGDPVDQPTPYFLDTGLGCAEWNDVGWSAPPAVHEVAEQRGMERFPRGRLVAEERDERLRTISFEGEDGSFSIELLMDRRAGVVCRPGATTAGPRCIPDMQDVVLAPDDLFFDASCERRVLAAYVAPPVGRVSNSSQDVYRFETAERDLSVARIIDGRCIVQEGFSPGRKTLYFIEPYPESAWAEVIMTPFGGPELIAHSATTLAGAPIDAQSSLALDELFELADEAAACGPAW